MDMEEINTAKNLPITEESIERERTLLHEAFEFDPVKREQRKKLVMVKRFLQR